MKIVRWDVEEYVALIDVFRKSRGKSSSEINEELQDLSNVLNRRAEILGIDHDEKYRNRNGMYMMFQNLIYIETNGAKGLSAASEPMKAVYNLYLKTPEAFELILQEFNRKYRL